MGIMVKGGVFKCFGTAQHIKNKFGHGYVIEIKFRPPQGDGVEPLRENDLFPIVSEQIKDIIESAGEPETKRRQYQLIYFNIMRQLALEFGKIELMEAYESYAKIRIAKQCSIGFVFGRLERLRELGVSEYSVTQTTLEQVFQSFANLKYDQSLMCLEIKNDVEDQPEKL